MFALTQVRATKDWERRRDRNSQRARKAERERKKAGGGECEGKCGFERQKEEEIEEQIERFR